VKVADALYSPQRSIVTWIRFTSGTTPMSGTWKPRKIGKFSPPTNLTISILKAKNRRGVSATLKSAEEKFMCTADRRRLTYPLDSDISEFNHRPGRKSAEYLEVPLSGGFSEFMGYSRVK
jgi:thiamine biosynthesis lipoprotein ApbE